MIKKYKKYFISDELLESYSLHNKTRINLLFNISSFVLILGFIATLTSLIVKAYPILIPALGNVVLALLVHFLIKYKGFVFAGIIYFYALYFLLFGNLILNNGTMHVGSPFWVMLLNILVFYIIGKNWGIFFLSISAIAFGYYIVAVLPVFIENIGDLSKATYYSSLYETVFALSLLGYVINLILTAGKKSDKLLIEQNKKLVLNNKEKTVMNKEIHHRVKNNLQVIISLMRLQLAENKNEELQKNYQEMINRVLAMSVIHEKMYNTDTPTEINLSEYFKDLSQDLISSYQINFNVELNYKFDLEAIGLKTIVPLALLFNELFSNSIKHAFSTTLNPVISLSVNQASGNMFTFEYKDNGKWKEPLEKSSFGMELIATLTSQLDGEMRFESEPETYFWFQFNSLDM